MNLNSIISDPISPTIPKLLTVGVNYIEVSTTVSNDDTLCDSTKVLISYRCADSTTSTLYLKPNFDQTSEVTFKFTDFSPSLKCEFDAEVENELGRAKSNAIIFETLPLK